MEKLSITLCHPGGTRLEVTTINIMTSIERTGSGHLSYMQDMSTDKEKLRKV